MKLDMANFTLAMTKPEIIANSIEIERKKFADYLAISPGNVEVWQKFTRWRLVFDSFQPNLSKLTFYD